MSVNDDATGSCYEGNVSSRRTRQVNTKLKDYIGGKPAGSCPGCNAYVKSDENAVVCNTCNAYWHYECANTNADEIMKLGELEFYCEKHRVTVLPDIVEGEIRCDKEKQEKNQSSKGGGAKVRVSKFTLNMEKYNKELLKNMDGVNAINRKDKGNQFTIHLNTAVYFIIVRSIDMLEGKYGMTVRRRDVDKKGNGTKDQYDVTVAVGQVVVAITMHCYHTNNNMHVQLMGSQVEDVWGVKVRAFEWFVDVILRDMILKVEKLKNFSYIKEEIRKTLIDRISTSTYCNLSTQITMVVPITSEVTESVVMQLRGLKSGDENEEELETVAELENVSSIDSGETLSTITLGSQSAVVDSDVEIISICPEMIEKASENEIVPSFDNETNTTETVASDAGLPVIAEDEEERKIVVARKSSSEPDKNKLLKAVSVLQKNIDTEETIRNLFSIMIKLKDKGVEMKSQINFMYQPDLFEQVNKMTIQLVNKNKDVETSQKACKDLEVRIKDLKRMMQEKDKKIKEGIKSEEKNNLMINALTRDNDELEQKLHKYENKEMEKELEEGKKIATEHLSKIAELEKDIEGKVEIINQLENDNSELVNRCKSLVACEAELSARIDALQAVNGHIGGENESELIVIKTKDSEQINLLQEEIKGLTDKVDKLNKSNSILKDQVAVKSESLDKIDNFYKEILDNKDQTVSTYLNISETNNESEKKLRRLLVKYRSDQELKFARELKATLLEKANPEEEDMVTSNSTSGVNPLANNEPETVGGGDRAVTGNLGLESRAENVVEDKINPKQTKGLCKHGKTCTNKNICEYSHEHINKACRFGDRCKKMDACLFDHSNALQSNGPESGENRRNWGAYEDRIAAQHSRDTIHVMSQNRDWNAWNSAFPGSQSPYHQQNQWGGVPINGGVDNSHGDKKRMCNNGTKCADNDCTFSHNKMRKTCRFGANCRREDRCLFLHNNETEPQRCPFNEDMSFWLRNAKNGSGRALPGLMN